MGTDLYGWHKGERLLKDALLHLLQRSSHAAPCCGVAALPWVQKSVPNSPADRTNRVWVIYGACQSLLLSLQQSDISKIFFNGNFKSCSSGCQEKQPRKNHSHKFFFAFHFSQKPVWLVVISFHFHI